MEFSFINGDGVIQNLNIKMGDKWSEKSAGNKELNSVFAVVDDKDGIVEEGEFNLLKKLLKKADSLISNSANDKQITKDELQELSKQLKDKTIDIEDVKLETIYDVDLADYSLEAIKERYPSDKFEIEEQSWGNEKAIKVIDKNSNKEVLIVSKDSSGTYITEKNFKGNDELTRIIDNNGELEFYILNGRYSTPIVDKLYKSLSAKDKHGFPTTSDDFLQNIKELNSENILETLYYYEQNHGQSLEDAINEEWGLDDNIKKEALAHIEKCVEEKYEYSRDFQNENSQISNEYHKGQNYSVKQDGEKLLVTNKDNGQEYIIDMEILTKDLTIRERVELKKVFQALPGEVLADLAVEISSIQNFDTIIDKLKDLITTGERKGSYLDNSISLKYSDDINVFVHELGHAVDYSGQYVETSSIDDNQEFISAFNKEMEAYIAQGGKKGGPGVTYATTNEQEMFAECYTLLMLGNCRSKDIITKFFPKTLKEVEKHIEYIRSLPPDERA